jgi:hypothetical protein
MILLPLLAAAAAVPPADRPYVMAHTDRQPAEVATCVYQAFDHAGAADNTPTDYGRKVDYRFKNLGGAVKSPTMTMEVHDDGTLILYGFKTWKGAARSMWRDLADSKRAQCFPELKEAEMVKPAKS